jgi:hypothetical protein
MSQIAITGNTYPVRDQLKALGGKWDPAKKAWLVPAAKADEARRLVAAAPKQTGGYNRLRSGYVDSRFGSGRRRSGAYDPRCWDCREARRAGREACRQCLHDEYDC